MNKKAQGQNFIVIPIVLLIFGFFNLLWYAIFFQFTTSLTTAGFYTGQAKVVGDNFLLGLQTFDWLTVFLLIGMLIALAISSFRIASAPVFFVITIIVGIFWGFISYFFNYVFIQMISADMLTAYWGLFPRTLLICTNLHWVALAAILIGTISLYAKKEKGQFLA